MALNVGMPTASKIYITTNINDRHVRLCNRVIMIDPCMTLQDTRIQEQASLHNIFSFGPLLRY